MLLETIADSPDSNAISGPDGLNESLRASIQHLQADCIRVLVEFGADHNKAKGGMNCLHYLFCYSFGTTVDVADRAAGYFETTKALVEIKTPINSDSPLGSHPLYSFLNCVADMLDTLVWTYESSESFECPMLRTIHYLLEAGANPNLNEEQLACIRFSVLH